MAQIILKDLLTKKVNERLNIFCHLCHILSGSQLWKIDFWESSLEKLDVEFITKEYSNVLNRFFYAQISKYVIAQLYDDLHDYIILY